MSYYDPYYDDDLTFFTGLILAIVLFIAAMILLFSLMSSADERDLNTYKLTEQKMLVKEGEDTTVRCRYVRESDNASVTTYVPENFLCPKALVVNR